MELLSNISNRWATSDGALTFAFSGESAEASGCSVTVDVSIADVHATIQLSDAKTFMPEIGIYEVVVSNDGAETLFNIERVSARYTSKYAIVEYGRTNNDGFDDENRYTAEVFAQAILAAEEAIERGCQRSFCKRRIDVLLSDPKLNELPVCDVFNIDCEDESVKLVSYCQASGVDSETKATIDYGTSLDSMIAMAAIRLAAVSYTQLDVYKRQAQLSFETISGTVEKPYHGAFSDEFDYSGMGNYTDIYKSEMEEIDRREDSLKKME